MNHTEQLAYTYLQGMGYTKNEIDFSPNRSPDFITTDGKQWEVKKKEFLSFTYWQIQRLNYNTIILIVDKANIITQRPFYEVIMGGIYIGNSWFAEDEIYAKGRTLQIMDTKSKKLITIINTIAEPLPFTSADKAAMQKYVDGWVIQ